jgi:predicted transposase YbfD/YdcC
LTEFGWLISVIGITLGQVKVNEKSNEITALPALLENLDITGAIITTDALNTQKNSARIIVEKGGVYLFEFS